MIIPARRLRLATGTGEVPPCGDILRAGSEFESIPASSLQNRGAHSGQNQSPGGIESRYAQYVCCALPQPESHTRSWSSLSAFWQSMQTNSSKMGSAPPQYAGSSRWFACCFFSTRNEEPSLRSRLSNSSLQRGQAFVTSDHCRMQS